MKQWSEQSSESVGFSTDARRDARRCDEAQRITLTNHCQGEWKRRYAYRYSVESTVYLDPAHTGKGFGLRLYSALIDAIRACSVHAAIGVIALPNAPSIALHERLGFRKVAHFEQVGYKQDHWVDVGYWQLLL
ncbi:GNAT family N-acetyltransferase [Pseudomonadota bacterium]